jgi:hypothetical protein
MENTTTPTTTDTPRTDGKSVSRSGFYSCATVPSDFARGLERELAQLKKQQLQLMKHLNESLDEVARLNRHLSGV